MKLKSRTYVFGAKKNINLKCEYSSPGLFSSQTQIDQKLQLAFFCMRPEFFYAKLWTLSKSKLVVVHKISKSLFLETQVPVKDMKIDTL